MKDCSNCKYQQKFTMNGQTYYFCEFCMTDEEHGECDLYKPTAIVTGLLILAMVVLIVLL